MNKKKLIGRMHKVPGLSIFSFDIRTGKIERLDPKLTRVIIEPGVIYRQCLNKKNFIKKLIKEGVLKPGSFKYSGI